MKVSATLRMIRISRWKLNIVASVIRGKKVSEALRILSGIRKKAAIDVSKALHSAYTNACHNNKMDGINMIVEEASVGRSMILKRSDIRARSRVGRIEKEFSQIRVVLCEGR